jgi:hypothetical protein
MSAQPSPSTTLVGPRKGPDGKMLARSLLGDPEDFESMSREQTRVRSVTPRSVNSTAGQTKDQQDSSAFSLPLSGVLGNSAVSKADTEVDPVQRGIEQVNELKETLATLNQAKAKQREERNKKLKAMQIFQRFDEVRDSRILARHQKRLAEWEAFRNRMSKRLNKDIDDLVISR